jgi:glycerophosphoryl diester phosphodiesterase
MSIPLVIAHRGDSFHALENSPDAIHRALSYPVDMIEIDIRRSSDNVLYVMHDKRTGRTAGKDLDLEQATSAEINGLRLKNGEPVPPLVDVMKIVSGRAGLNLELKSDGAGLLAAERLIASDYQGYVLVSSFKEEEVLAFRRVLPAAPAALIFDVFATRNVRSYGEQGYSIISLRKSTAGEKLVNACHERGIQVYVWTVDDEEEMRTFISRGVDGIYSNRPGVLKEILRNADFGVRNGR